MTEIGGYCTNCGSGWQPGQKFCAKCGQTVSAADAMSRIAPAASAQAGSGTEPNAGPASGEDVRYPSEATIGAVLLTLFLPFIALIAALVLRAQETRPVRRDQLKNWALASGAWLATGWVIAIVAFSSVLSAVSPPSSCKGGINLLVPPTYESSDGKHWVGTFACNNGGSITKPVPASQVPGGG